MPGNDVDSLEMNTPPEFSDGKSMYTFTSWFSHVVLQLVKEAMFLP